MRPVLPFLVPLLLVTAATGTAQAQAPDATWRTLDTPHFRMHYTAPAEEWTRYAAARLESIRERVVGVVGYAPPEIVDVVVRDPVAAPNGMAYPLLRGPRLELWTSPPEPESVIGNYRDWPELLVVHEETHLVHLLRPSRNPWRRAAGYLLPLGPIALAAPRWVIEGYATLVEGELTASGRPNGDLRAALLRARARAGRLPSYAQLASDGATWQGRGMAYLAGSAYLEWLVARSRPDALRDLWARMTARTPRSFDAAFEGVFGDAPQRLYDRFRSELTWRALEIERRLGPPADGTLWQDLAWSTGPPAVSPDGGSIALVRRAHEEPSRLVVWDTAPDASAEAERAARVARVRARDPEDVAPVFTKPPARTPKHELPAVDGLEPLSPRWLPDGALLFVRDVPDARGVLHPDLFRWDPARGAVRRLTVAADLRAPDPAPDGTWAIAVRARNGLAQLVRVALDDGAVTELTPPKVDVIPAWPRLSPDGTRVAYVKHARPGWALVVRELAGGAETVLPVPLNASVAFPAWTPDGRGVLASVGAGGLIDLVAFRADGAAPPRRVTRTLGAARAPAPARDGRVFFLGLEFDGLDVRVVDASAALAWDAPAPDAVAASAGDARAAIDDPALAPAVRPVPPPEPQPFAPGAPGPSRPYGAGRAELQGVFAGRAGPSSAGLDLGVRAGDVVGRWDALALGALSSNGGPRGLALAGAWRGLPVTLGAHLYDVRETPSRQPLAVPGLGPTLDAARRGLELRAAWQRTPAPAFETGLAGTLLAERLAPDAAGAVSRRQLALRAHGLWTPSRGKLGALFELDASGAAGRTAGTSWTRTGLALAAGVSWDERALEVGWRRDRARDGVTPWDRVVLGGEAVSVLPGSALAGRVQNGALPVGTAVADEHEAQSVTLELVSGLPVFYERHRAWDRGAAHGDWLRLWGVRWETSLGPVPILRLPAVRVQAGVARLLDEPFRGRTRAYLALALSP